MCFKIETSHLQRVSLVALELQQINPKTGGDTYLALDTVLNQDLLLKLILIVVLEGLISHPLSNAMFERPSAQGSEGWASGTPSHGLPDCVGSEARGACWCWRVASFALLDEWGAGAVLEMVVVVVAVRAGLGVVAAAMRIAVSSEMMLVFVFESVMMILVMMVVMVSVVL